MVDQILLFWIVLAALAWVDNLVLVPRGADHLRLRRGGDLSYLPKVWMQWAGRDLVLLNPLNPFDRLVLTRRRSGRTPLRDWALERRRVRRMRAPLNSLAVLGGAYLFVLVALAVASFRVSFGHVLLVLVGVHLAVWAGALAIVVRHREILALGRGRIAAAMFETLIVPGHLANIGKRLCVKVQLDLAGLTVGLRQLHRMHDEDERMAYGLHLGERLDELDFQLEASPNQKTWLTEARQCLRASVPPAG